MLGAQSQNPDGFQAILKQGFQLHQEARFAEAIPVLMRAHKLDPLDYFANLLLGIDLLRTGKAAEAIPYLQSAARAKAGEEIPEEYLGEAEAGLKAYALAAEALQRAVLRGHGSEESLEAWAGFALERFHQIGQDLRASEEGLEVARRLQNASTRSGQEWKDQPHCALTIPSLERRLAAKRGTLDAAAAYGLSVCYAQEAGAAAARFQAGAVNPEDQVALHRLKGDVQLRLRGDAAAAEAEYKLGLAARPRDPGLLERLAEAQLSAGELEAAGQSAEAALAADAHRRGALQTLATLAMNSREYEKAVPWLRKLAEVVPGDRTVAVELGRALAQTGAAAEALEWLRKPLDEGYPDEKGALHALLARVLRSQGKEADATRAEAEARRLSDAYQARGGAAAADKESGNADAHEKVTPDAQ